MLNVSTNLPLKENSLFKRALKCYENKQYKNGTKFINQILSNPKFADHGETLAIKGLLYFCLGRKEEAYELVKKGLKLELKSYLCWHTYGVLHRFEKNFEEAIKCYRNALKWNSNNVQILQDLSILQIQTRDSEGYLDTRAKLFQLVPTQRTAWAGYAVAYHLNKDYDSCLKVLEAFKKNLVGNYTNYSLVEYNELLLYENFVIEESGDIEGAIKHILENVDSLRDQVTVLESLVRFNIALKKYKEAENLITKLFDRNPERITYYEWFFKLLGKEADKEKYNVLTQLLKEMPKARLPRRLILNYVEGDTFSKEVDAYLRRELRRGVPALFVALRSLYEDGKKVGIIEKLMLKYQENLLSHGALVEGSLELEPPTTLMWVYCYLSQHYCCLKNTDEALKCIDLAISHTPTLPDLYIIKGKILKEAGNYELASDSLMEAHTMDLSDKFINSKCAHYHFKANRIKLAEDIASVFTPDGILVMDNLSEMQCIWFLLQCALAFERLGDYGQALKKCHEIDKHYSQFYHDQLDFHSYCLRELTLKSYVRLLRFEEEIKGHRFYKKAAHCAMRIYTKLFDEPRRPQETEVLEEETCLTSSELRKMKNKERKAKKKAELQKPPGVKQEAVLVDRLHPDNLRNTHTPLEDVMKFLIPLKTISSQDIATYLWAFEIYYRKHKILLMLQSIKRGYSLESNNPMLHEIIIRFTLLILKLKSENTLNFPISEVVEQQMSPIWLKRTPQQMNEDFINNNKPSLCVLVQGARCMYLMDNSKQTEALEMCTRLDDSVTDASIAQCLEVLNALKSGFIGPCEGLIEEYIQKCHKRFPLATAFQPLVEINNLKLDL